MLSIFSLAKAAYANAFSGLSLIAMLSPLQLHTDLQPSRIMVASIAYEILPTLDSGFEGLLNYGLAEPDLVVELVSCWLAGFLEASVSELSRPAPEYPEELAEIP
jgi:hypothetical protein